LKRTALFLLAALLSAASAGEVKLQPKGIGIANGELKFQMPYPQPNKGNKWAAVKQPSENEVSLDYGENCVLKCTVKDDVIVLED